MPGCGNGDLDIQQCLVVWWPWGPWYLSVPRCGHILSCLGVAVGTSSAWVSIECLELTSHTPPYSSDVYVGMVIAATCNCIPGNVTNGTADRSILNCQHYTLDQPKSAVNSTILTRGQCAGNYTDVYTTPVCDDLAESLQTWGRWWRGVRGGGSEGAEWTMREQGQQGHGVGL